MKKIRTIKGTRDILPRDVYKWQKIESVLRKIFEAYVYKEIRTPVFENTSLFARGVGEFSDIVSKEMYTFTDKGGESITLRPELTASVARSYIQHNFQQEAPLQKLWYAGPLFRQERPQAGRQRQFHQFGVELIGSEHPEADAEVIDIACGIYKELGLKNWQLHINSIGSTEARKIYVREMKNILLPYKNDFCDTCKDRFEGNILRLFDCKNPSCIELMKKYAPSILDHLSEEDSLHFNELCSVLDAAGIDYIVDPALVRGLDYYTRTTFEIKGTALGAQDALCGGGRYDCLIKDLDGPDTPAVGFAAGIERLIIAMEAEGLFSEDEKKPELYIAPMQKEHLLAVMPLISRLRKKGISVHAELLRRSVKAMMRDANRQGVTWTAVVGDLEVDEKVLNLKNMHENSQQRASWDEVESLILSGRDHA